MSSFASNARIDTAALLVNSIVNMALFLSTLRISQMLLDIVPVLRFVW